MRRLRPGLGAAAAAGGTREAPGPGSRSLLAGPAAPAEGGEMQPPGAQQPPLYAPSSGDFTFVSSADAEGERGAAGRAALAVPRQGLGRAPGERAVPRPRRQEGPSLPSVPPAPRLVSWLGAERGGRAGRCPGAAAASASREQQQQQRGKGGRARRLQLLWKPGPRVARLGDIAVSTVAACCSGSRAAGSPLCCPTEACVVCSRLV